MRILDETGVEPPGAQAAVAELFAARYPELVRLAGTLVHGKGFSYPVWLVSYPLKDPATLVFRNAAGTGVAVLHEPANP